MVKKTSENSYDVVIVGSSLAGILAAQRLTRKGQKVLLLEASDQYGKTLATVNWQGLAVVGDVAALSAFPEDQAILEQWSEELNKQDFQLSFSLRPNEFVTDLQQELKPFLGFGDHAPEFYHCIDELLNGQRLGLVPVLSEVMTWLLEQIPHKQTLAEVSKIYTAGEGATMSLAGLQINSAKDFFCDQIFWLESPRTLLPLLPQAMISQKQRTRWTKRELWAKVGLDLFYKSAVLNSEQSMVLLGSHRDDAQPVIGQCWSGAELKAAGKVPAPEDEIVDVSNFPSSSAGGSDDPMQLAASETTESDGQLWRWQAYLSEDLADEPENVNEVLKRMRRMIKKQMPLEEAVERIVVWPASAGHFESKEGEWISALSPQLKLGHSSLRARQGLASEIIAAQKILESLELTPAPKRRGKKEAEHHSTLSGEAETPSLAPETTSDLTL